jgi:hypothetical protein
MSESGGDASAMALMVCRHYAALQPSPSLFARPSFPRPRPLRCRQRGIGIPFRGARLLACLPVLLGSATRMFLAVQRARSEPPTPRNTQVVPDADPT